MTRHITTVDMILMNEDAWKKMSAEDQEIIRQASADTEIFAKKNAFAGQQIPVGAVFFKTPAGFFKGA